VLSLGSERFTVCGLKKTILLAHGEQLLYVMPFLSLAVFGLICAAIGYFDHHADKAKQTRFYVIGFIAIMLALLFLLVVGLLGK
jgi:hypothetical protein